MKSAPVGFRKTLHISDKQREETQKSVASQREAQKSEIVNKYEESESEKSEDY